MILLTSTFFYLLSSLLITIIFILIVKKFIFLLLKHIKELTECLINTMNYTNVCCTYIKVKLGSLIRFAFRNFHRFNDNSLIVLPRTLNASRASKCYHLSVIRVVCAYRLDLIFNL